ncbi:L,D-transpeptidase family protein [Terricaulis sp.]|uniref:L,D-transpeptidase family protein n=1 Tax=Terricaulis sp. TaxID=2768686 RepID=UPI0037833E32
MKAMSFSALALIALAACSPADAPVTQEQVPMSDAARSTMDQVNSANFAALSQVPAIPDPAVPTASTQTAGAATGGAQQEATVAEGVHYDAAMVRIEVLLDRAHFSPGVIDGYNGENVQKAVRAYQTAHGMTVNGQADEALLQALTAQDSAPALIAYRITAEDVRGPFAPVPQDLEAMSRLEHVGYTSAREALAEKFHMDEDLLQTLNPGVDFTRAGAEIVVASTGGNLGAQVASITVDKDAGAVLGYDARGALIAYYPATIGSADAPAPSGDYTVRGVAMNPTYRYDPARLPTFGRRNHGALNIAAGPNNPVGAVWIALSADTYGIHGAPFPDQVSKTQSHGCVRLTNWDAIELGQAVSVGVPVRFRDGVNLAERPTPQSGG